MSGPVLQAPLHSPPIIQQLITKQTSPLMSFVLAWSDDLSVDLSDLISYLLKKKTEQNNNPMLYIVDVPFHYATLTPTQVFYLSAWSILFAICHCLSNTRVLNFFARLSRFQWISNSETIWIDRTEAEKYLSASRQKRTIEIYLYKTFTNKYLLAVKIQWFRKCKDWEFSFGLSFNYCAEILSIPASWYRHSASHCWIFATFWHLVAITNCTLQCWSCSGVWRRGVQSLIDSSIDGTDNCWVQCSARLRVHLWNMEY